MHRNFRALREPGAGHVAFAPWHVPGPFRRLLDPHRVELNMRRTMLSPGTQRDIPGRGGAAETRNSPSRHAPQPKVEVARRDHDLVPALRTSSCARSPETCHVPIANPANLRTGSSAMMKLSSCTAKEWRRRATLRASPGRPAASRRPDAPAHRARPGRWPDGSNRACARWIGPSRSSSHQSTGRRRLRKSRESTFLQASPQVRAPARRCAMSVRHTRHRRVSTGAISTWRVSSSMAWVHGVQTDQA